MKYKVGIKNTHNNSIEYHLNFYGEIMPYTLQQATKEIEIYNKRDNKNTIGIIEVLI